MPIEPLPSIDEMRAAAKAKHGEPTVAKQPSGEIILSAGAAEDINCGICWDELGGSGPNRTIKMPGTNCCQSPPVDPPTHRPTD